jgi:NAD-dependent SIR2 family protein deacetylase
MSTQCTECGNEGGEHYARDKMCKECRKESIRNSRMNKKIEEENEKLERRALDKILKDLTKKLDVICMGQKDMQIKQRDLEIKLENKGVI